MTQQNLLDHAEVCARLLRNTSNPKERLLLWQLRELWNALAVDGLHQRDIEEQVEALADTGSKFLAQIRPARQRGSTPPILGGREPDKSSDVFTSCQT